MFIRGLENFRGRNSEPVSEHYNSFSPNDVPEHPNVDVLAQHCNVFVSTVISWFQDNHGYKQIRAINPSYLEKTGRKVGYVTSAMGGLTAIFGFGTSGKLLGEQTIGILGQKKHHRDNKHYACTMPYNFQSIEDVLKDQLIDVFSLFLPQIHRLSKESCGSSPPCQPHQQYKYFQCKCIILAIKKVNNSLCFLVFETISFYWITLSCNSLFKL